MGCKVAKARCSHLDAFRYEWVAKSLKIPTEVVRAVVEEALVSTFAIAGKLRLLIEILLASRQTKKGQKCDSDRGTKATIRAI